MAKKTAWETYDEKEMQNLEAFCKDYKSFLTKCKTERECVDEIIKIAEANGYRNLESVISSGEALKTNDKIYAVNMKKAVAMFHIGEQPLEKGMNIVGSHIDSPRLDLKQNPLYEDSGLALLDTHYYGGVKKYQWVAQPLALHGVIVKTDGTVVKVAFGEDPSDPVVGVSDLLIHLSQRQLQKKGDVVVEGEDLNILVGSMPLKGEEKEPVKKYILKLLKEKYDIEEEDFQSAELEAVPAGPVRDYGLDGSMLMGYGHDDRVCAYPSLKALLEMDVPEYTSVCLFVDKEEVGNNGATGMASRFFENMTAEVMNCLGQYSELGLRRCLQRSRVISSDVTAAFDPNYPSEMEKNSCAYFGRGISFNKYTGARGKSGASDANAEYIAKIRRVLDENAVTYQMTEMSKVDHGGGGTIAYVLANYGMEVIDGGVPVQNMHAPYEVVSKADVYEAYKAYKAFLKHMW